MRVRHSSRGEQPFHSQRAWSPAPVHYALIASLWNFASRVANVNFRILGDRTAAQALECLFLAAMLIGPSAARRYRRDCGGIVIDHGAESPPAIR